MTSDISPQPAGAPIRAWLFFTALLVFCMVIVGGATRLTDSGLSITEWQPLLGAIPPLSDADWQAAIDKYKLIPEAQTVNAGMTLAEFKFIYWWEWAHRLLGRFIGLAFFLPLVVLVARRMIGRRLLVRLVLILVLGGLQGGLGWYMVASGLVDRVDVSQYRLAAHLTLAVLIFGALLWVGLDLDFARRWRNARQARLAILIVFLVLLQIAAGGFVAGLDAGMAYNTWPLMDGAIVPKGLAVMEPWWKNLFENALTAQFDHRVLAYAIIALVAIQGARMRTGSALILLLAGLGQFALGVWTLLAQVPLGVALAHQGGALIFFAAALWHLHERLSRSPVPDRQ